MGETGSRSWTLAGSRGRRLLGNCDLRIVLQLLKAAVRNYVPGIDALDCSLAGVRDTWLDVANLGCAVQDDVDECGLAIVLNGRGRNECYPFQGVHKQPGVDELVGEQSIVFVIEERAQFDRSGSGIDLVVEGEELSGGDFSQLRPIIGVDFQPFSLPRLRLYLRKAVFGDGKDHGDRLYLGDHCQGRGSVRLYDVPGIHQPQTYASRDRSRYVAPSDLDLVILHRALIVFYRAFVLQYDFFLIIERLLGNAISRPRVAVTLKIHSCLFKNIRVALECALRLQELRLIGSRIDIDQGLAFADELAFLVVDLRDHSRNLAGNRVGIDRSDGPDGFQIHSDVSFLCGGGDNCDWAGHTAPGRSGALGFVVMTLHQHENHTESQQQRCPHEKPLPFGLVGMTRRRRFSLLLELNSRSRRFGFHPIFWHQSMQLSAPRWPIVKASNSPAAVCRFG